MMPGHLTACEMMAKGKIDRVDTNALIQKYLDDAITKLELKPV